MAADRRQDPWRSSGDGVGKRLTGKLETATPTGSSMERMSSGCIGSGRCLKQYEKYSTLLRNELTSNQSAGFRV